MKNFKAYQLAVQFYNNSENLYLKEPLRSQFNRAKLSIVLNLAEGSGKPSSKDKKRFYAITLGSLREVQAILELTNNKKLVHSALIEPANKWTCSFLAGELRSGGAKADSVTLGFWEQGTVIRYQLSVGSYLDSVFSELGVGELESASGISDHGIVIDFQGRTCYLSLADFCFTVCNLT